MSQAMSVQTTGSPRPDAAQNVSSQKTAGKAGGFQTLLSLLLSSMKKAAAAGKGEAAKPGEKSAAGTEPRLNRKSAASLRDAAKDAKTGDLSGASRDAQASKALDTRNSRKPAETAAKEAKEGSTAKKRALSDEIVSGSRSHDALAAALNNNAELKASKKENASALARNSEKNETGKASVSRKKSRIDLIDARKADRKTSQAGEAAEIAKTETETKAPKNESQLTIDLSGNGARKAENPSGEKNGAPQGQSFSARLATSLRDGYNAEIVKHSTVILRNDDTGLIRLNLKPESLGNVKVRLNLADNNITGTIIVESEAARDAFEANIEHLAKSFIDSGFQDAKLQVSVDAGASGGQGGQARREAPPNLSRAAKALDAAVPQAGIQGGYRGRTGGVSVFA